MNILIFGRTGQVSTELRRQADVIALGREVADLSDPAACPAAIRSHRPDVVINAAAYTAVDRAEDEEELAQTINGIAPGRMARACADLGIPLVHISTDYVFDGTGTEQRRPDVPTAPLNAYGRTKLAGEEAIRDSGAVHVILRTSWVFSPHGGNFVKTMLRLAETKTELSIVDDQIGGPTPADSIAAACLTIAAALRSDPELGGAYHFAGTPETSWAGFAEAIFERGGHAVSVSGIPTAEYPTPAPRPLNSRLDCATTERAFGIAAPDWRGGLERTLNELSNTRGTG